MFSQVSAEAAPQLELCLADISVHAVLRLHAQT